MAQYHRVGDARENPLLCPNTLFAIANAQYDKRRCRNHDRGNRSISQGRIAIFPRYWQKWVYHDFGVFTPEVVK
jgi:hypothetical protein